MNAMLYVRGAPADFDGWAALGATGWGWVDVLPSFIRGENNVRGASELHGDSGPVGVGDRVSNNRLAEAWMESALKIGLDANDDFNGPDQEGAGYYQLTQIDGKRCSSYSAYVRDQLDRENLTVIPFRQATRLLFDVAASSVSRSSTRGRASPSTRPGRSSSARGPTTAPNS